MFSIVQLCGSMLYEALWGYVSIPGLHHLSSNVFSYQRYTKHVTIPRHRLDTGFPRFSRAQVGKATSCTSSCERWASRASRGAKHHPTGWFICQVAEANYIYIYPVCLTLVIPIYFCIHILQYIIECIYIYIYNYIYIYINSFMCIYIIIYIFMYHLSRIILGGKASISPYCIHKLYQFSGWGVLLRHLERGVIAELH